MRRLSAATAAAHHSPAGLLHPLGSACLARTGRMSSSMSRGTAAAAAAARGSGHGVDGPASASTASVTHHDGRMTSSSSSSSSSSSNRIGSGGAASSSSPASASPFGGAVPSPLERLLSLGSELLPSHGSVTQRIAAAPADVRRPYYAGPSAAAMVSSSSSGVGASTVAASVTGVHSRGGRVSGSVTGGAASAVWRGFQPQQQQGSPRPETVHVSSQRPAQEAPRRVESSQAESIAAPVVAVSSSAAAAAAGPGSCAAPAVHASGPTSSGAASAAAATGASGASSASSLRSGAPAAPAAAAPPSGGASFAASSADALHTAKVSAAAGASAFAGAVHRVTGHTILPTEDMQRHTEHCVMGYTPEQIYAVVADVASYDQFLPWCKKSVIVQEDLPPPFTRRSAATLHVGFSFFKESYTSDVALVPSSSICATIRGTSTLLRELHCDWFFWPLAGGLEAAGPRSVPIGAPHNDTRRLLALFFQGQKLSSAPAKGSNSSTSSSSAAHASGRHYSKSLLQRLTVQLPRKASASAHEASIDGGVGQAGGDGGGGGLVFPAASLVDFRVAFAFRNPLHNSLSSLVMDKVVSVMTSSFEARCRDVHGAPTARRMSLTDSQAMPHLARAAAMASASASGARSAPSSAASSTEKSGTQSSSGGDVAAADVSPAVSSRNGANNAEDRKPI